MILLKTPHEIEAMAEAGRVSALALRIAGQNVRPGISTLELDGIVEECIRKEGGTPAFKGYGGFPGSICASVNDQVVHGIPSKNAILRDGDIISIDTGAVIDGWVGDNAWTYPVGNISQEMKDLLDTGEAAMWAGIENAQIDKRIGDIGHAVAKIATDKHYGVVKGYTGHGIGRDMHEDPLVPNFGHRHFGTKLKAGMVLAIEPIITAGIPKTKQMDDGWLVCTCDGLASAHFEKTVALTDDGPLVLTAEKDHKRPI